MDYNRHTLIIRVSRLTLTCLRQGKSTYTPRAREVAAFTKRFLLSFRPSNIVMHKICLSFCNEKVDKRKRGNEITMSQSLPQVTVFKSTLRSWTPTPLWSWGYAGKGRYNSDSMRSSASTLCRYTQHLITVNLSTMWVSHFYPSTWLKLPPL
jgi:hypothetical protein